jgi:hypothetical protein
MSGNVWPWLVLVYVWTLMLMGRLDRLGKQMEAVFFRLAMEIARTEDRRDELRDEWNDIYKQAAKERRQFWWFWGIIGAVTLVAWALLSKGEP